jgi:hypothetical protein
MKKESSHAELREIAEGGNPSSEEDYALIDEAISVLLAASMTPGKASAINVSALAAAAIQSSSSI